LLPLILGEIFFNSEIEFLNICSSFCNGVCNSDCNSVVSGAVDDLLLNRFIVFSNILYKKVGVSSCCIFIFGLYFVWGRLYGAAPPPRGPKAPSDVIWCETGNE